MAIRSELIDNEITRAWIDVIKPRLDMGYDKPTWSTWTLVRL